MMTTRTLNILIAALVATPALAQTAAKKGTATDSKKPVSKAAPAARATPISGSSALQAAQQRIESLKQRLNLAEREYALTKARFETGAATSDELPRKEYEIKELHAALNQEQSQLNRVVPLLKTVNVTFRDASLPQAAKALTEATGVPINVDTTVPTQARLSLTATDAPLARVLDVIGDRVNVQIAPAENGVELKSWPTVEVNGQVRVLTESTAPWSVEWGVPPTLFALSQAPAASANPDALRFYYQYQPNGLIQLPPTATQTLQMPSGPFSMAPLGDKMVVLAEPGTGPRGEVGIWLTTYRLDGTNLKKASAVFHESPAGVMRLSNLNFTAPNWWNADAARLGVAPNNFFVQPIPAIAPPSPATVEPVAPPAAAPDAPKAVNPPKPEQPEEKK